MIGKREMMMRVIRASAVALAIALAAASCVKPLKLTPDIAGEIIAFEVEGQTRSTVNAATRTVAIEVGEGTDLAAAKVTRIELVETASCGVAAGDVLDLTAPLKVTVKTVAEYEWTVTATKYTDPNRRLPGGGFDEWSSTGTAVRPVHNPWPRGAENAEKPEEGEWETTRWWDTGNKGVTLLKPSNSTPTEAGEGSPANAAGRAARLETVWAGLKVAGGNIYFGRFGGLVGLDATCEMGHPWQTKPKGLKGWYKYFPQKIDRVGNSTKNDSKAQEYLALHPYGLGFDDWMGSSDSLHVNVALWASPDGNDVPFTVNTSPKAYVDFRRETPGVIAWGAMTSAAEQAEWGQFTIDIEYLTDGPLPANTRLILQATPSKNCNYFIAGCTGGGADRKTGSLMYVDEFELIY